MSLEPPPMFERPAPVGPSPERAYHRGEEDRARAIRAVVSTLLAVCGGFAAIFLFFAAMGAVDLGDAIVATIVALVLGAVWFGGFYYRQRTNAGRTQWRDRERRGF